MRKILLLCLLSISLFANNYLYKPAGISFEYSNLTHNKSVERKEPLSVVFEAGKEPFSVSVFFKIVHYNGSLESFIKNEKQNEKKGGYEKEVTIKKIITKSVSAYEITRDAVIGKIHWFVFQSKKDKKLYSFWFTESRSLQDETKQALEGYSVMKSTLVLSK